MSVAAAQREGATVILGRIGHGASVGLGAIFITLALFLVLPLMQAINKPPAADLTYQALDTALLPPPPPVLEEEPEEEEQPEESPPQLADEDPPLDLGQLELALNPGYGSGWGGDFAIKLGGDATSGKAVDALFSEADLDQKPRVVHQPGPQVTEQMRRKTPGQVVVIFTVDRDGRVQLPKVQRSSDPVFERAALAAIRQWRFEPGRRKGEPVQFRMRVPITFPKRH